MKGINLAELALMSDSQKSTLSLITRTQNFITNVYSFLEILLNYPQIGTLEHKEKNIRGFTMVGQIRIFYKIRGRKIILPAFFDNRQNPIKKPV